MESKHNFFKQKGMLLLAVVLFIGFMLPCNESRANPSSWADDGLEAARSARLPDRAASPGTPDLPEREPLPEWATSDPPALPEPFQNFIREPLAVFPLKNATGKPKLDWLSAGLQDSLTIDLRYVSELHTKKLTDFNSSVAICCPDMNLRSVAELDIKSDIPTGPYEKTDWRNVATDAGFDQFLWGNYALEGDEISVNLRVYGQPNWTLLKEISFKAPLEKLLHESSVQILRLLEELGIPVKAEEKERILSVKTKSVTAWRLNSMGFWWEQKFAVLEDWGRYSPSVAWRKNASLEEYQEVNLRSWGKNISSEEKILKREWGAYLTEAVQIDSQYAEAWNNLGWQRKVSDLDSAVEPFRNALKLKPDLIDANIGIGYCLVFLQEAISYLRRGIILNPSLIDHYTYLIRVYQEPLNLANSGNYLDKGLNPANCVDELMFLEKFLESRNRQKDCAKVYLWCAELHQESEEYDKAEAACRNALTINEKFLGEKDNTFIISLERLADILTHRSTELYERGYYDDAVSKAKEALSIREKILSIGNWIGIQKIDKEISMAETLNMLATLYRDFGEYNKAEVLYKKALEILEKIHPSVYFARTLNNLAVLYDELGRYEQAEKWLLRSLFILEKSDFSPNPDRSRINLNIVTVLNNLGMLYIHWGDYRRAFPFLTHAERDLNRQVFDLNDEYIFCQNLVYNNLGYWHLKHGDWQTARELFEISKQNIEKTIRDQDWSYNHPVPFSFSSWASLIGIWESEGDFSPMTFSYGYTEFPFRVIPYVPPPMPRTVAARIFEHKFLGIIFNNLAAIESMNGIYDIYEKANFSNVFGVAKKIYHENHPFMAVAMINRGMTELRKSQTEDYHGANYAEAENNFQQALSIRKQAFGEKHPAVARVLEHLGVLRGTTGNYEEAAKLFSEALTIRQQVFRDDHPEIADSLYNMAGLHKVRGDYAQAITLFQQALDIREKTFGHDHYLVAITLCGLADVYDRLGEPAHAKELYQQALDIWDRLYRQKFPEAVRGLNGLAVAHFHLGEYKEAESCFQRSLEFFKIKEAGWRPSYELEAAVLNNMAVFYQDRKDFQKAERLFLQSLSMERGRLVADHPNVATIRYNLAGIYETMEEFSEAEENYYHILPNALEIGDPELLWHISYALSRLLANQNAVEPAVFFGKQAVNTIQEMRGKLLSLSENLQTSFLKKKEDAYRHLADLLIARGRLAEAQQVMTMLKEEEYYDFMLRGSAGVRKTAIAYTPQEQPWKKRYQEIAGQIAALGHELTELKRKKQMEQQPDAIQFQSRGLAGDNQPQSRGFAGHDQNIPHQTLDDEESRIQQIRNDLEIAHKAFRAYLDELTAGLKETRGKETYAEFKEKRLDKARKLQRALRELGPGTVAVHYLVTNDKLHIILTTPEAQLAKQVPISAEALNEKIYAYRETIRFLENPLPEAQELYRIILEPISQELRQARAETLMLSLDSSLRYLPVAALHDGQTYAAENYRLVIYTAAAELDIKDRPAENWRIAGLGLSQGVGDLSPLPAVPKELESIVHRDASDSDGVLPGVIHLDQAFTRDIMESVLQEYPVLHIASHFVFRPGTHLSSYLMLGDGTPLPLSQIEEKNYDFTGVDMLTLSACNTAMGVPGADGREIESFGALAQDQGAKGVLATLWPVSDESTGIFMQNLYRIHGEQSGITKAEALHQAQLLFIRGNLKETKTEQAKRDIVIQQKAAEKNDSHASYAHPFYWAPFILMGNWL